MGLSNLEMEGLDLAILEMTDFDTAGPNRLLRPAWFGPAALCTAILGPAKLIPYCQ